MPLKKGSTSIVRLYKGGESLKYFHYGPTLPSGEYARMTFAEPGGQPCSKEGAWVGYQSDNPDWGTHYYRCQKVADPRTEITLLKDNLNRTIHKRVTITFNANGGSGGSSQTRTWDVEQITQPSSPSRSNYTFKGWYTSSSGGTKLTFPRDTPLNNTTYYAQWTASTPPSYKWRYNRSLPAQTICWDIGGSLIGTSCSTLNDTQVISGYQDGYSGCIEIICKA